MLIKNGLFSESKITRILFKNFLQIVVKTYSPELVIVSISFHIVGLVFHTVFVKPERYGMIIKGIAHSYPAVFLF